MLQVGGSAIWADLVVQVVQELIVCIDWQQTVENHAILGESLRLIFFLSRFLKLNSL